MKHATNATDKRTALRLLANGDATVAEIARLLGKSRQLVAHWAKLASLDPVALRADRLELLWHDQRQALIVVAHGQPPVTVRANVPKRKRLK